MDSSISFGDPISGVGDGGKRIIKNKTNKRSPEAKPSSLGLKVGELIKGEIVEVYEHNIVRLKLLMGELNAELLGDLQKRDELFFIVQSVHPSLVLKIHSVPFVVRGVELSDADIIRILNLKKTKFFEKALDYLRKERQSANREELISIYEMFSKLSENNYKDISSDALFTALFYFHESESPFDTHSFEQIKHAFVSVQSIETALNSLNEKLKIIRDSIFDKARYKLSKIDSSFNDKSFFSMTDGSFGKEIVDLFRKSEIQQSKAKSEISYLAKSILSKEIVRIMQMAAAKPYIMRIPYRRQGLIKILEINCDIFSTPAKYSFDLAKDFSTKIEYRSDKVVVTILTDALGEKLKDFTKKIESAFGESGKEIVFEYKSKKRSKIYSEGENAAHKNITFVI
jgi:hypothetical protein